MSLVNQMRLEFDSEIFGKEKDFPVNPYVFVGLVMPPVRLNTLLVK